MDNREFQKQAREWIKDCIGSFTDVTDDSDVDGMSDEQVTKGISKHYSGGIAQFFKDGDIQ